VKHIVTDSRNLTIESERENTQTRAHIIREYCSNLESLWKPFVSHFSPKIEVIAVGALRFFDGLTPAMMYSNSCKESPKFRSMCFNHKKHEKRGISWSDPFLPHNLLQKLTIQISKSFSTRVKTRTALQLSIAQLKLSLRAFLWRVWRFRLDVAEISRTKPYQKTGQIATINS
jgi:hypothetical protein